MSDLESRLRGSLPERYRLEGEIGRGGMATVLLAEDERHGRKVAIKVLHPQIAATLGSGRFLREIQIAAQLEHPYILSLIDSGEADGLPYYVMPYMEGDSLRDRLERDGPLSIDEAVRIAGEAADGLDYAHRQGIVHRDIKPGNILLTEQHALIADFGIARAIDVASSSEATVTGLAVGTPKYMSPEQASGAPQIDGRADIYALGCVLWEMLAGEAPFDGPTPAAILARKTVDDAPEIRTRRRTVPPELEGVVARSMAVEPADRYATAMDFAQALARPELERRRAPRRRVLHRRLVNAAVAVVLLVAGVWLTSVFAGARSSGSTELHPRLVAVLPFDNVGGDPEFDQWSTVAAGLIAAGLDGTGHVSVVEQGVVAAQWAAAQEGQAEDDGGRWIEALASSVGAGILVRGDYFVQGDSVHFQARIIDATEGAVVAEFGPYAAPLSTPVIAIEGLREQVMIGVVAPILLGDRIYAGGLPQSYEAMLEFSEAKQAMEGQGPNAEWNIDESTEHLWRAIELDSTWNWPIGRVIINYANVQQFEVVDSLRSILEARKTRLAPVQRILQLPYVTALLAGDRIGVLESYQDMRDWSGEPWTHHLVAWGMQLNNRAAECLEAMEVGIEARDTDTWDTLPWCLHALGRYQTELDTVRWARKGGDSDPQLMEREAIALAGLGRPENARSIVNEARSLALSLISGSDREYRFHLEVNVGLEVKAHGHPEEGQEQLERGVAWYETRPPAQTNTSYHRYDYARALYAAGRWTDAREQFRSLQREFATDSTIFLHHNDDVSLLGYLGTVAARLGDEEEATRIDEELRHLDRRFLWGHNHYWRAAIAGVSGEQDRAVALLADALSAGLTYYGVVGPEINYPKWDFHIDPDFESLRDYPPFVTLTGPQT